MKTLDWHQFFLDQQRAHGKVLFTASELANVAQTSLHSLNTELGRLVARGLLYRYARALYGMPGVIRTDDLVAAVDPGAYVTGFFALFRHNLVTQVPVEVTCFTSRRHNRKADRPTPAGRLRFIHVPPRIYSKPKSGVLASAEQALCDFVWLNARDGIDPWSLVTFRHLETLDRQKLTRLLHRYPATVQTSSFVVTV